MKSFRYLLTDPRQFYILPCGTGSSWVSDRIRSPNRRQFTTLLGGAVAAWPLAARAQQPDKTPRVGYIRAGTSNNDPYRESFARGMHDLGYVEGRNIAFEFRHYGDDVGSIPSLISDLLQAKVDVIVVGGTPAIRAAQAVRQTIPIVMIAAHPLGTGLIAGLARPGGNTTGLSILSAELTIKRLELLKEVVPQAIRIAILKQPGNPAHPMFIKEIEPTAGLLALTFRIFEASRSEDFDRNFALMREWPADAVIVRDDPVFNSYRAVMSESAARHRLPLICGFQEMTQAGCLFSYSVSFKDMWYRSATYVDKILRGAKPADLPVEQASRYQLVINLQDRQGAGHRRSADAPHPR